MICESELKIVADFNNNTHENVYAANQEQIIQKMCMWTEYTQNFGNRSGCWYNISFLYGCDILIEISLNYMLGKECGQMQWKLPETYTFYGNHHALRLTFRKCFLCKRCANLSCIVYNTKQLSAMHIHSAHTYTQTHIQRTIYPQVSHFTLFTCCAVNHVKNANDAKRLHRIHHHKPNNMHYVNFSHRTIHNMPY